MLYLYFDFIFVEWVGEVSRFEFRRRVGRIAVLFVFVVIFTFSVRFGEGEFVWVR